MTMYASKNGTSQNELELEATHYSNLETEEEWESPEANPYSNPEAEWETHEASHYSNPEAEYEGGFLGGILGSILGEEEAHYSNPEFEEEWESPEANPYSNPEAEWETHEASHYSNPEAEWETHEASHYSNPYSNPEFEEEWESPEASHYANPYSSPEAAGEWETHETSHYSNPEAEWEADPFFPLIPLAAKFALPFVKKAGVSLVKRLVRRAPRAINRVVGNIMRPSQGGFQPNLAGRGQPGRVAGGAGRAYSGWPQHTNSRADQQQYVNIVFSPLSKIFGEGESEAAAHEASFFGANEFEAELGAHEAAHEAALTEVMAAEASHTESESEAEAILGAALPVTIRIMGARQTLRPVIPALARSNARLIQGLHRQGTEGRQLLRVVPAIQRRTVASLKAAQRQGKPITPALATQVMAGQTARVLNAPHICGRSLVRNMAIRQGTVRQPQR